MLKKSITKEEINELPLVKFKGKYHVITNKKDHDKAIEKLRGEEILGFDTETRPAFKKGESYKIAMLQLSTAKEAFIFRLNILPISEELIDILSDEKVLKTGVAVSGDLKGLKKLKPFKPAGFVELETLAKKLGIKQLGLRSLGALIFGERLSKKHRLTNWENHRLTPDQLKYAATDAWLGYHLYIKMNELLKQ